MKLLVILFPLFYLVYCKKESASDLYALLNDPRMLSAIEKRLKLFDDENEPFSDEQVGCYEKSATLGLGCTFTASSNLIIKTNESLQRGAEFLNDFVNISCPRECTTRCCEHPSCDTAVYQDKGDRKCFLFHCGDSGDCVFSSHSDYWRLTISEATHNSHSYVPGGATHSHENELENLRNHDRQKVTTAPPHLSTTVKTPVPTLPGLNEECPSYNLGCADKHAECLGTCRCRVGYHEKHGICRKLCSDEEFECDKFSYGTDTRQCILNRYVCDDRPDCDDGSDEINCREQNKPAFLNGDGNNNIYNNPFYNSQSNQPDAQFSYGFPVNGLTNQQQAAIYPSANQIYSAPGTANQNAGGQFFLPGMTNQNAGALNLLPMKGQYNQQWPLSSGVGSQIYPNNIPYQAGQQQNFVPAQTGFIQNPVQPVQKVIQNVQPVQQNSVQGNQQIQSHQVPSAVVQQNVAPVQKIATNAPVLKQDLQKSKNTAPENEVKSDETGFHLDHYYDTVTDDVDIEKPSHRYPDNLISHNEVGRNKHPEKGLESGNKVPYKDGLEKGYAYNEGKMENKNNDEEDQAYELHRHSEETEDNDNDDNRGRTYPPSTKTKTQIASPTQSTVSGQKTEQIHSEGFPDYSWLKYDDDSPRVSGKKGKIQASSSSITTDSKASNTRKKPGLLNVNSSKDKVPIVQQKIKDKYVKPGTKVDPKSKFDVEDKVGNGRYDTDSQYPDDYRLPFEDYQRPSSNRRPSYNRYDNRYDNSRRRPSPGSRYPYYDTGFQQGWNREREHYPVWDSFKDEYYYPDVYPDRQLNHDLDYDGPKDKKPVHIRPGDSGSRNRPFQSRPDKLKQSQPASTTHKTIEKVTVPTTLRPETPSATDAVVKAVEPEVETENTDSKASADTDKSDDEEPVNSEQTSGDQSVDESSSTKSTKQNNSVVNTGEVNSDHLNILNVDAVEVESYTDSFQGPIVALALGLAITLMLLIIVGCRLRTVKRRLRKGRQLHSNEADYLINGMYL
ncbi:uncharacterized protein LOC132715101 [Ruditapes philippinarum]|uniref:uncharacterized protein LOC132715101 n=1 Tax=Ruditapes philippinarum TaxID=129788 RepID=UPI00295AB51B|nr:uncharacterized protein LOC132715101 [Ruditapes philippinarum]